VTEQGFGRDGLDGATPYKGLGYYAERDAPFFFGREEETSIIAANLVAARRTLLYGASGVGKSSLLRAGVARHLRERASEIRLAGSPAAVVVVFPADEEDGGARRNSWRDDPLLEIAVGIEEAVAELGLEVEPVDRSLGLPDLLQAWGERLGADVLLVLDQFEEYFLYHGGEQGPGSFFEALPRVLTSAGVGANVLISIREDAYSRLDSFKGRIPSLYDNYLRVNHLDRDAARAAIERPIEQYNRLLASAEDSVSIEPELVDAVLDAVQTGNLVLGQSGAGTVAAAAPGDVRIETPFLQLVLERLWSEEIGSGSRTLRLETLERLGGAERIVRTHLDGALASLADEDKDLAARAFRQLVTPSGTKIAHLPSDLAALEDAPRDRLAEVLEQLAAARILRPIAPPPGQSEPRYEIFHDVLASAILDWRARYLQERAAEARERRHRHRLVVGGSAAGLVLAAAVAVLLFFVVTLNGRTNDAEQEAFLNEARTADGFAGIFVAHKPLAHAVFSPDGRHVLTAAEDGTLEAWSTGGAAGPNGGKLLRTRHDEPLHTARFDTSGTLVITAGPGGVGVWSLGDQHRRTLPVGPAEDAVFSPDGRLIAVAGDDGITTVLTWPGLRTIAKLLVPSQSEVRSVEFSHDGRLVATASDDGSARVWDLAARRLARTFRATREGTVYDASFSESGDVLVTAAQDGTARVWDLAEGRQLALLRAGGASVQTAEFSPDETFVVTASGKVAHVWRWHPPQQVALVFRGNNDNVTSASFNRNGSLVVTAGRDGTARLWGVALPDLELDLDPAQLEKGGRAVRVTFTVTNSGGGSAAETSARISARGFRPKSVKVPALRPGGVWPVEADLPIPGSARGAPVEVVVSVDPEKRVTETEYANNTAARSIVLAAPDLALETLAVSNPAPDGRLAVTVRVANRGAGTAEPTTVVAKARKYRAASAPLRSLGPGQQVQLRVELRPKPGAPAQQARLTVDQQGTTGDRNMRNNSDLTELLPAFGR
jgi:dipeptidyl aminopeptidase/acylaminoacyl peptidase